VEKWRTTAVQQGNVVKTTPPNGATATTSVTDAFGRAVELRQHTTADGVNGPYQSTWYTYNAWDELTKVVDHDKNEWRNKYDVKGRLTETVDPDKGKATNQYTSFDDLQKSTLPLYAREDALLAAAATELHTRTGGGQILWDPAAVAEHLRAWDLSLRCTRDRVVVAGGEG
jgi:YD repeat-containing protein